MVRRLSGPACDVYGVTAMDFRPAELQNFRGPPGPRLLRITATCETVAARAQWKSQSRQV